MHSKYSLGNFLKCFIFYIKKTQEGLLLCNNLLMFMKLPKVSNLLLHMKR